MARLARLVVPGMPHHITQRGNCRQQTFFNDGDYEAYLKLMAEWCREWAVVIWSYCPADWPWSSARTHLTGRDDCLV
jgi:putative transposase